MIDNYRHYYTQANYGGHYRSPDFQVDYQQYVAHLNTQAKINRERKAAKEAFDARRRRIALEQQRDRLIAMATYPEILRQVFEDQDSAKIPARFPDDV